MIDINSKKTDDDFGIEPRCSYHFGYFTIINMTYTTIYDVVVTHRQSGSYISEFSINKLDVLVTPEEGKKSFEYVTGNSTPYNYWYIQYSTNMNGKDKRATKTNFYCSLTSSDNGYVVILIRQNDVKIILSNSNGCSVSTNPI